MGRVDASFSVFLTHSNTIATMEYPTRFEHLQGEGKFDRLNASIASNGFSREDITPRNAQEVGPQRFDCLYIAIDRAFVFGRRYAEKHTKPGKSGIPNIAGPNTLPSTVSLRTKAAASVSVLIEPLLTEEGNFKDGTFDNKPEQCRMLKQFGEYANLRMPDVSFKAVFDAWERNTLNGGALQTRCIALNVLRDAETRGTLVRSCMPT